MPRIYLALGTNKGDRLMQIKNALDALGEVLKTPPTALSDIVETPAWGFEGPDFLNCVVYFDLPEGFLTPTRLLNLTQRIERQMGRRGGPEWDAGGHRIYHDRPIDIDILFWDTKRIRTTRLILPHPLMAQRDFVMIPLRQIADVEIMSAFPEIFAAK